MSSNDSESFELNPLSLTLFFTDENGKDYKATDSTSDYKVVAGPFKDGGQTTTLEITVSTSTFFFCKFVVDGITGSR